MPAGATGGSGRGGEARQIQPTAPRQDPKGVGRRRRRGDDTLSRVTGQKRRENARRAASADRNRGVFTGLPGPAQLGRG